MHVCVLYDESVLYYPASHHRSKRCGAASQMGNLLQTADRGCGYRSRMSAAVFRRRTKMQQRIYGYMRVSTNEQNEDRQRLALLENGVPEEGLFLDKLSGKNFERPEYKKLIRKLRAGDTLFIKSIDRLGRNYRDIIEQWRIITKEKGADVVVLDMPLLDTRIGKDLLGTFMADIVLQLLSFVAENERKNIRERQAEGIAAAKARGVRFGRPSKPVPEEFQEYTRRWGAGEVTASQASKALNMPLATFKQKARLHLQV